MLILNRTPRRVRSRQARAPEAARVRRPGPARAAGAFPMTGALPAAMRPPLHARARSPTARAASGSWPARTARLMVPCAPGGANDVVARVRYRERADAPGRALVVDHRPGTSRVPGTGLASHAPADGCTLTSPWTASFAPAGLTATVAGRRLPEVTLVIRPPGFHGALVAQCVEPRIAARGAFAARIRFDHARHGRCYRLPGIVPS